MKRIRGFWTGVLSCALPSVAMAQWQNGCPGCGPNYDSTPCTDLTGFACVAYAGSPSIVYGRVGTPTPLTSCVASACCSEAVHNTVAYTCTTGWTASLCIAVGVKWAPGVLIGPEFSI